MNLEDIVEARLAGQTPDVPSELRDEVDRAVTAHEAIQYAIGETILVAGAEPVDRSPPALPDDYTIIRELGRGGMGVVYLASQRSLGREIAVKVLRPGETTFGSLVRRFLGEAHHLARLRHPNIVSIHEIGRAGDEPYYTMDYVQGESLAEVLARERPSPTRALTILKQAAEGVRHAHEQGIIHRDLKPGNILLDAESHVYVTDFGLARDMAQASELTRSGDVMGTPAYMAPEQARGQSERVGETTDVHALGEILYEMLTGRPPYGCDAAADVLVRLLKEEPVPPRKTDRRIPRDLETICLKAIAKDPDHRYGTVRALLEDIGRFESGEPVRARRPSLLYHAGRLIGRQWKIGAAVAATALVLLAIAPRLFDKSVAELRTWGDERHTAGDHSGAIGVYRRALGKATGGERTAILQHLIRCAREIGDVKSVVNAAMPLLEENADLSLDEYDYMLAMAVLTQLRTKSPNGVIALTSEENRPLWELAERRLQIFLDGPHGTKAQRAESRDLIQAVQRELRNDRDFIQAETGEAPRQLPEGTPPELLTRSDETELYPWARGEAAYAAALALKGAGDVPAALAAYRKAFDLMRSVYPTYEGVKKGMRFPDPFSAPDTRECRMLKKVSEAIQRLDPSAPDMLTGGIRFRVEGADVPKGILLGMRLTLYDPTVPDPVHGFYEPFVNSRPYIAFRGDQATWVGVVDGRYRLRIWSIFGRGGEDMTDRLGRLLKLDFDALPREIEIAGDVKELTIPARILKDITLQSPAAGAPIDLSRDFFRWSAVPGAARYQVIVGYFSESPKGGTTMHGLPTVESKVPRLCLGTSQDRNLSGLSVGRAGVWWVSALDADGRQIAVSVELNRPFLVTGGLADE